MSDDVKNEIIAASVYVLLTLSIIIAAEIALYFKHNILSREIVYELLSLSLPMITIIFLVLYCIVECLRKNTTYERNYNSNIVSIIDDETQEQDYIINHHNIDPPPAYDSLSEVNNDIRHEIPPPTYEEIAILPPAYEEIAILPPAYEESKTIDNPTTMISGALFSGEVNDCTNSRI